MAIILNINTAFETACVILSNGSKIIHEFENNIQKDHAAFLQPAIKSICEAAQIRLNNLDAVSVVNGPGSYTGLRVGLSSAKALCYALNKPIILLNTLDVMAHGLKLHLPLAEKNVMYCPLIDARRMEVFTSLYDENLTIIKPYSSEILNIHFLEREKINKTIVTGGSGSLKLRNILSDENFVYINPISVSKSLAILSDKACSLQQFSSVAYSEPFYLKFVYFKK